jgi:hypothetical protein
MPLAIAAIAIAHTFALRQIALRADNPGVLHTLPLPSAGSSKVPGREAPENTIGYLIAPEQPAGALPRNIAVQSRVAEPSGAGTPCCLNFSFGRGKFRQIPSEATIRLHGHRAASQGRKELMRKGR